MFEQLMEMANNPHGRLLKQPMVDILGHKYLKHEEILERISHSMGTQQDTQKFLKLIVEVYEVAYTKAVDDQSDALKKLGFNVTIKQPTETPEPEIFK